MTAHLWQPYPSGYAADAWLLQCSACRVLVDHADTARALPGDCPERTRLPHLVRSTAVGIECAACVLPPLDEWDWECGGDTRCRMCDVCRKRRRSVGYDFYLMATVCAQCATTQRGKR